MRNALLENVLRPLVARFGTAAAAVLISYGYESGFVQPFVDAAAAVLLLGVDLLLSRYYRKLTLRGVLNSLGVYDVRH